MTASVFFSSDVANPDTYIKLYSDMQMYTTTMTQPDPEIFMNQYVSWEISSKANKWQGRNITRWTNDEYDKAFRAAEGELDPVKRTALFIRMNDMVIGYRIDHPGRGATARAGVEPEARRRQAAGTATFGRCRTGIAEPFTGMTGLALGARHDGT